MTALARNISRFSEAHLETESLKMFGLLSCVALMICVAMVSI